MNFTWARAGEAERARRQASVAERGRYEELTYESARTRRERAVPQEAFVFCEVAQRRASVRLLNRQTCILPLACSAIDVNDATISGLEATKAATNLLLVILAPIAAATASSWSDLDGKNSMQSRKSLMT